MIDVKPTIVSALQTTGLGVFYEMFIDDKTPIPCITYKENNNADVANGDTLEYSELSFTIKIWTRSLAEVATYSAAVDAALKALGFTRTFSDELVADDVIQKITRYTAIGYKK